ncbi:MAG: aldehyde dehydrogenase family protein, partial [Negativibacillus sp.]
AAPHLTPVTLELGGKSPCIVDKSADLPSAARRIVFGKFLNCGQTCVAPDYILCHHKVKQQLLDLLKKEIRAQFPNALTASDYGHIVNEKHLERLIRLIDQKKVVIGGAYDREKRKIEPTVMDSVTWQDPIMQEEIFGPVLPVLTFDRVSEVIAAVNSREKPLAFYVFAENKKVSRELLSRCAFGGGCVNDTIVHLATSEMGFGGVGESGMGSYHGRAGFETFSHRKSIVQQKNWLDVPLRYRPYSRQKEKLLRLFLK